jgi:hypothetical protein
MLRPAVIPERGQSPGLRWKRIPRGMRPTDIPRSSFDGALVTDEFLISGGVPLAELAQRGSVEVHEVAFGPEPRRGDKCRMVQLTRQRFVRRVDGSPVIVPRSFRKNPQPPDESAYARHLAKASAALKSLTEWRGRVSFLACNILSFLEP